MAEQDQNRSEDATPFKREEAKKRGQVAKSLDFNTFISIAASIVAIAFCGHEYWMRLCELCARLFISSGELRLNSVTIASVLQTIGLLALSLILPFMLAGVLAAIVSNLVQTGPVLSADPLKAKFERLNPVAGFKRIFNKRMVFEALKSVLKLAFFGAITYAFFKSLLPGLVSLGTSEAQGQADWLGSAASGLLFRLGMALAVVGLIDFAYTRWQFSKQLMMSRREVKEETRGREGDPQIRAKIRELQRENLKQAKSMGRLPEADVLITNPSHFAVALRYDRRTMNAPVVLAKGSDHWVAGMKDIARKHGVPIHERRRLARALFKQGHLDLPVPPSTFLDVARVYAELGLPRRDTGRDVGRYEVAR